MADPVFEMISQNFSFANLISERSSTDFKYQRAHHKHSIWNCRGSHHGFFLMRFNCIPFKWFLGVFFNFDRGKERHDKLCWCRIKKKTLNSLLHRVQWVLIRFNLSKPSFYFQVGFSYELTKWKLYELYLESIWCVRSFVNTKQIPKYF